jgi:hypothetical protein
LTWGDGLAPSPQFFAVSNFCDTDFRAYLASRAGAADMEKKSCPR